MWKMTSWESILSKLLQVWLDCVGKCKTLAILISFFLELFKIVSKIKKNMFSEKKNQKSSQTSQIWLCEGGAASKCVWEREDAAGKAQNSLSMGGGCSGTLERWQGNIQ